MTGKYVVIYPQEKPYSPSSQHLSGPPGLSNALIPLIKQERTVLATRECMLSHFSRVPLFVAPWTVAPQALLSMRFSRQ